MSLFVSKFSWRYPPAKYFQFFSSQSTHMPDMNWSVVWVIMGWQGDPQDTGILVVPVGSGINPLATGSFETIID